MTEDRDSEQRVDKTLYIASVHKSENHSLIFSSIFTNHLRLENTYEDSSGNSISNKTLQKISTEALRRPNTQTRPSQAQREDSDLPPGVATYLDAMSKQHAATILATVGTAEPLSSKRVPKATKRFVEGWFSASLPRLSLALGVGVAGEEDADHSRAEGEASSGEVSTPLALGSHTDEETQTPGVVEEVGDDTPIGTSEKRRSVRVRRATKRFEEGWFSASLPRLSSALSVAVADRKES